MLFNELQTPLMKPINIPALTTADVAKFMAKTLITYSNEQEIFASKTCICKLRCIKMHRKVNLLVSASPRFSYVRGLMSAGLFPSLPINIIQKKLKKIMVAQAMNTKQTVQSRNYNRIRFLSVWKIATGSRTVADLYRWLMD